MKKIILLSIFSWMLKTAFAQSVSPQVVATSGGYVIGSNIALSYTVGEPAVTTLAANTNILTQGFQQPVDIINGLLDIEPEKDALLSVYPVPSSGNIWFGYLFSQPGTVSATIYNLLGQPMPYTLVENYSSGKVIHQLDAALYPAGNYVLAISYTGSDNSTTTLTRQFQIIQ